MGKVWYYRFGGYFVIGKQPHSNATSFFANLPDKYTKQNMLGSKSLANMADEEEACVKVTMNNVLTFPPPDWGMLRRPRRVLIFL